MFSSMLTVIVDVTLKIICFRKLLERFCEQKGISGAISERLWLSIILGKKCAICLAKMLLSGEYK